MMKPKAAAFVIVAALLIALAAALHDFLVATGVLPFASPALLNIATPVLVIALGAALIDRFVRSLADVEKTNTELETRIHEREQLLVMPNPWDAGSARALEQLGFPALATPRAGFAWPLGRSDHRVTLVEALAPHVPPDLREIGSA